MVGPMARPGARGLGSGLGLKYEIVLWAGPGLDTILAGRPGPGPHNSICGPGPGQVCTTAAGPGRAWASNHVCGPGLDLDFRPVQGPSRLTAFSIGRSTGCTGAFIFRYTDLPFQYIMICNLQFSHIHFFIIPPQMWCIQ